MIAISSENKKAYFRMAQAFFNLGDFDGALQSCTEVLKYQNEPGKSKHINILY